MAAPGEMTVVELESAKRQLDRRRNELVDLMRRVNESIAALDSEIGRRFNVELPAPTIATTWDDELLGPGDLLEPIP